jgi:two-component system, NtrC family, response regulator AtoC
LADLAQNSHDLVLFIQGETGTGKNLAVRFFREHSTRKHKAYKELSLLELSNSLLESELFGHVKGAFTGAATDKCGLFETANGGILFLDEIGDYDLAIQAKIMRFIEYKIISPVGSAKEKKLDLQLILATNKNIPTLIQEGKFREDLYQRIHRFAVTLPPLRERPADIRLLTIHFFNIFKVKERTNLTNIHENVHDMLATYPWPGNIRELQSVIWEACANARLYNDVTLQKHHFRKGLNAAIPDREPFIQKTLSTDNFETNAIIVQLDAIESALKQTYGNKNTAAELLNKTPDQLLYFIKKKVGVKHHELLPRYPVICKYYKIITE